MYALFRRGQGQWDRFHMDVALRVSQLSKDPDRKVGMVLVTPDHRQMSMGYNGFPADLPDDPRLLGDKTYKLQHVVHAEENCLKQAPFSPAGCTAVVTRFPCVDCARKLVEAGVIRVVAPRFDPGHPTWGTSWSQSLNFLHGNHVAVSYMEVPK